MTATQTLYLSRLVPNARSRDARRDVNIPYEMHRTLLRAFEPPAAPPGTANERAGRLLYRIEHDAFTRETTLLVQSEGQPDWRLLPREWLAPGRPPAIRDGLPPLQPGQLLRFRLRANPVRNMPRFDAEGNALRGKRVALVKPDDQIAWLRDKLNQGGAVLGAVEIAVPEWDFILKQGHESSVLDKKGRPRNNLYSIRFDGTLTVQDPEALRETVISGIGPSKAFGNGLLSLAPMPE